MLKWMHCIGVDLESPGDNNSSQSRFYYVTIYGFILFFINLFCNGMAFTKFIQRFEDDHQQISSSVRWNAVISATNLFFMTIGSHLSLIFGAYSTWPYLIQILRELEMERFFERKDFHHFRRIYISGLGFLMTVYCTKHFFKSTIIQGIIYFSDYSFYNGNYSENYFVVARSTDGRKAFSNVSSIIFSIRL